MQGPHLKNTIPAVFSLPNDFKFPSFSPKRGVDMDWREEELHMEEKDIVKHGGDFIKFKFPNTRYPHLKDAALVVTADIDRSGGAATFGRFPNDFMSIFKSIRLIFDNTQEVFKKDQRGIWRRFIESITNLDRHRTNWGAQFFGIDTTANRNTNGNNGKQYWLPLWEVFFQIGTLPTMNYKEAIEIWFEIDATNNVVESDDVATTNTINITEAFLHYKSFKSDSFKTAMDIGISSKQAIVPHITWHHFKKQLASGSTYYTIPIEHKASNIKMVVVLFRTQSTLSTTTTLNRLETWIPAGILNYQFVYPDGKKYPIDPIDFVNYPQHAFQHSLEELGLWNTFDGPKKDGTDYTYADFIAGTSFYIVFNLEEHDSPEILQGLDTKTTENQNPYVELNFNGALASNIQAEVFLLKDEVVKWTSDGPIISS